jgi:hypothetical protein
MFTAIFSSQKTYTRPSDGFHRQLKWLGARMLGCYPQHSAKSLLHVFSTLLVYTQLQLATSCLKKYQNIMSCFNPTFMFLYDLLQINPISYTMP